jgi:hypothetical protein
MLAGMTTTTTPRRIRIGGIGLHVEAPVGEGEPLVIVHGGWTDHTAFDAVVEPLARSFTVIRYDRRGHSRSEYRGPAPRRRDEEDLTELIDVLGLGACTCSARRTGRASRSGSRCAGPTSCAACSPTSRRCSASSPTPMRRR